MAKVKGQTFPYIKRFGDLLLRYRTQLGLKQTEMAERLSVSEITLIRYENGKATQISLDFIIQLSQLVGRSASEIVAQIVMETDSVATSDMELWRGLDEEARDKLTRLLRGFGDAGDRVRYLLEFVENPRRFDFLRDYSNMDFVHQLQLQISMYRDILHHKRHSEDEQRGLRGKIRTLLQEIAKAYDEPDEEDSSAST